MRSQRHSIKIITTRRLDIYNLHDGRGKIYISVKYVEETIAHKLIVETQQIDGRTFEFGHGAQPLLLQFIWFAKLTQKEDRDQYNKQMYKQQTAVAFCITSSNSSSLWHILVLMFVASTYWCTQQSNHLIAFLLDLCLQGVCSQMWCTTSIEWKVDNVVVRIESLAEDFENVLVLARPFWLFECMDLKAVTYTIFQR